MRSNGSDPSDKNTFEVLEAAWGVNDNIAIAGDYDPNSTNNPPPFGVTYSFAVLGRYLGNELVGGWINNPVYSIKRSLNRLLFQGREWDHHAEAVIPPRSHRKARRAYDRHIYKARNLVECFSQKIKNYRRIATRY